MNEKILFVDDDTNLLAAMERNLRLKFHLETAASGEAGLAKMAAEGPFAVIVADMQMPGMNGVQLLSEAQKRHPDTVRLMLTGNADQLTAAEAVNIGHVFQFLTKPCPAETVGLALQAGLKQYQLITAERELLEKTLNGCVKVIPGCWTPPLRVLTFTCRTTQLKAWGSPSRRRIFALVKWS